MNISIIGCGYVGLVTGACFAKIGHHVICMDVDKTKVNLLSKGKLTLHEKDLNELISDSKKKSRISFTSSFQKACKAEIIFICVDTPFGSSGNPNLTNFNRARDSLLKHIKKETLVVTKSTVPIGTNEKLSRFFKKKMLDKSIDIKICSNPEFLKEGSAVDDFLKPNRIIVGSSDAEVIEKMKKAYSLLGNNFKNFIAMSAASAELVKYASNSFLATKISFMNEVSRIADAAGANMHEVKEGMGHDPRIGDQFLDSGLGYGGSCFPKDLAAMDSYQRKLNLKGGLITNSIKVNNDQILYFLGKIYKSYKDDLKDLDVVIWGLSFKPNTNDLRESIAIKIIKIISPTVKHLHLFDPACSNEGIVAELSGIKNYSILTDQYSFPKVAKCLLICTEWDQFRTPKYQYLKEFKIFDGRNILDRSEVEDNNIEYYAIGT